MRSGNRPERKQSDFEQKIIDIRRVTRVVAGGKRFNFRVTIVIGNRKGAVGVGLGKADDTSAAIEKAFRQAKKNLISVPLTENFSIPHEVETKFGSAKLYIRPVSGGKGLVAGGPVRIVLDLAGIKNANAKIISSSKNKLNNATAAINALKNIKISAKSGNSKHAITSNKANNQKEV